MTENIPPYIQKYLTKCIIGEDLITSLINSYTHFQKTALFIDEQKSMFAYDKGKWTIKEMTQHLIDTERIFVYRALCFSRMDTKILSAFDENNYVKNSFANDRKWNELLKEFENTRKSSIDFFKSLNPHQLQLVGNIGIFSLKVETLGFQNSGHLYHHIEVLKNKYL